MSLKEKTIFNTNGTLCGYFLDQRLCILLGLFNKLDGYLNQVKIIQAYSKAHKMELLDIQLEQ